MTTTINQKDNTQNKTKNPQAFKTVRIKDGDKKQTKSKYYSEKDIYKKPEFIPFKKSSEFVTPFKTHAGFYVKKSNEQVYQVSTNIGTKNKRFVDVNGVKQDVKAYVVTCYENNIQVDYLKCDTIQEAELKTRNFLKNYVLLSPKTSREESDKGVIHSVSSYVFKGKKTQSKNELTYSDHLSDWKAKANNNNFIEKQ